MMQQPLDALGYHTLFDVGIAFEIFIRGLSRPCMPAIRGTATMTCSHRTGSARTYNTIVAIPPYDDSTCGGLRQCCRRTLATKLHSGYESIATLLWLLQQQCCKRSLLPFLTCWEHEKHTTYWYWNETSICLQSTSNHAVVGAFWTLEVCSPVIRTYD